MFELKMPKLGESVTEGTIGKWLKKPGDTVSKYDLLVEVQTDKVNTEIPSPVSGTLREVKVEEGPDRSDRHAARHLRHRRGRDGRGIARGGWRRPGVRERGD